MVKVKFSSTAPGMLATILVPSLIAAAAALVSAPAAAQACEVKLGAVGPMSGGSSPWGLAAKAGADFAAALANEEGGLKVGDRKCTVKVVSFDSLYTAAGGAAAANFLVSEKVHVTLGPVGSPETVGFRPVAKRNGGIINFSASYMPGVITPEFPHAFHAYQSPTTWGPLVVKAAADQFKFKSVMIVGTNDQGGTDGTRQLIKLYGEAGVKGTEEYYQRGTTNFSAIATRVMIANPEVVDLATMPPQDALVLVKALVAAGFKGIFGALGGIGLAPFVQGADGIGNLKAVYWLETSPTNHPGIIKLKADYQRLMKAAPPENSLFPVFALAGEVALQGIAAAGTDQDGDKVGEALRKLTPESRYMGKTGWRGKAMYGVNQELTFPVGLGMVIDGKQVPTRTIAIPAE